MILKNLKTYFKFLSKNKFYTFVSIFGFSVSLMFVILLSLYTRQELSVDNFHKKKDRIFLMSHNYEANFGNTVAPFVKDKCPEVEAFCRMHSRSVFVGDKGTEKLISEAIFADSTFFNIFSFRLIEGNPSQVLVTQRSVVVTQDYAHKLFDKENPMGKTLNIDNREHTITGIMENIPLNSQFPQCDFVASYSSITNYWSDEILTTSNNFGFTTYFLEKEGADLQSKIPLLLQLFKEEFWFYKNGFTDKLEFIPLEDVYFTVKSSWGLAIKTNSKDLIKVYGAIAILILIIATLNYINMTVAQAGFRGKEAAIKKLLGGSRGGIMVQLLKESLLMTVVTFCLGLVLALISEPFFNEVLTTKLEMVKQLTVSTIFAGILFILFISLVSGLMPALIISKFNPLEIVKGTFTRKIKSSYSKGLIIFQYIVAIALLICSFFIKQQSDFLGNYDLGYQHDNVFSMYVDLDTVQTAGFRSKLLSIPGVNKVSFSCGNPMDRGNNYSFEKDGEQYSTQEILADDDFFDVYGICFTPSDVPFTEKSLLVNNNLFNSPLANKGDMTIELGHNSERLPITGILSDFHIGSLHEDRRYLRIRKKTNGMRPWGVSVRIDGAADIFAVSDKIQKEYIAYTGGEHARYPQFADSIIQDWYKKEQNLSKILSAFTLLTILISVMGVFAMSLYMIKQKEKEIGVRKVSGATGGQVLWMLNKESLIRVLIAFVIACPIAYYMIGEWLNDFSYRISLNEWTFAVAGSIIAILTLISVSYMTWRAAQANPVDSLKNE